MAQKTGETYKAFAHRVYNESRRANPPLPEEEVTRIMLKILPPSVATLMIGKNCKTVSDFINQLEKSIIERNIINNSSENTASANAAGLNELTEMFGKLMKKQENTENKILALLNGKDETVEEDDEKEDMESKINKGIYMALENYNKRGGFQNRGGRGGYVRGNASYRGRFFYPKNNNFNRQFQYNQNSSNGQQSRQTFGARGKNNFYDRKNSVYGPRGRGYQTSTNFNKPGGQGERPSQRCFRCGGYDHYIAACKLNENFQQ